MTDSAPPPPPALSAPPPRDRSLLYLAGAVVVALIFGAGVCLLSEDNMVEDQFRDALDIPDEVEFVYFEARHSRMSRTTTTEAIVEFTPEQFEAWSSQMDAPRSRPMPGFTLGLATVPTELKASALRWRDQDGSMPRGGTELQEFSSVVVPEHVPSPTQLTDWRSQCWIVTGMAETQALASCSSQSSVNGFYFATRADMQGRRLYITMFH